MDRFDALVKLLKGSPITERMIATNLMVVIEKGKWTKEERSKVDALYKQLDELVKGWRSEDWDK